MITITVVYLKGTIECKFPDNYTRDQLINGVRDIIDQNDEMGKNITDNTISFLTTLNGVEHSSDVENVGDTFSFINALESVVSIHRPVSY